MPFISFTTNHKLTLRQENDIAKKTGELITILPGKKEENLMLHLEDNQIMYFRGEDIPCMMIAIKLYRSIDFEAKKKFTEELIKMIKDTTNIDPKDIYVSFDEYQNWGKQGTLFWLILLDFNGKLSFEKIVASCKSCLIINN